MKEVSICMTHYNRKSQLLNTLQSIQNQQNVSNLVEIIIVDDVSKTPLIYNDFDDFDLDIKLISVQTRQKWWINPCVAFNTAFKYVNTPRTIIQNAECLHVTNIIGYVINNLKQNQYIAMSALSLTQQSSNNISRSTKPSEIDTAGSSWYCHSMHRPKAFNFCAAISTSDLLKIGGFDDRFAKGIYYDDDAFLHKLAVNNIEVLIDDNQTVYHQWHEQIWESLPNKHELGAINRNLLNNL
jgi:glycosyltransferase involved in cell wall biosynthesis